jgi:hypothetical protein
MKRNYNKKKRCLKSRYEKNVAKNIQKIEKNSKKMKKR